jgi:hypothetical protein
VLNYRFMALPRAWKSLDMAPHHKEIKTFPHHKHMGSEKVIGSLAPTLGEVLQEIEGLMILP